MEAAYYLDGASALKVWGKMLLGYFLEEGGDREEVL